MTDRQWIRMESAGVPEDGIFEIVSGLSGEGMKENETTFMAICAGNDMATDLEDSGPAFEWISQNPGGEETPGTSELREILGNHTGETWDGAQNEALWIAVIVLGTLVIALGALCVGLLLRRKKPANRRLPVPATEGEKETERAGLLQPQESGASGDDREKGDSFCGRIGKVHNIGRRSGQQDSLGVTACGGGILAVVADGMGGLADGDRVSQKIVLTMMQDGTSLAGGSTEGRLYQMVAHVNSEVNHMLGMPDQYKSGSTLVAVLVENGNFQWVSVGDSRLYLYRGRQLLQLNREHVYETDLIQKAVNQEISFREIALNPQKKSVSSFIGMGELKHIDGSMRPVTVRQGDRLLLMSDGVFNTLSEQEICDVLSDGENAERAARALENRVLACQNPKQDNFTAIIIDISF